MEKKLEVKRKIEAGRNPVPNTGCLLFILVPASALFLTFLCV